MDKKQLAFSDVKHKQGFALLITLSVLSILVALTIILLSYFEKVQHDAANTTALIQADVYYADITNTFSKFKNKKTLFSMLYKHAVPLRTKDGRFVMNLHCKPLSNGVNINWLGMENKRGMRDAFNFAQTIFDMLAQEYNLEDPDRLHELILAEIGGKSKFVKKEYSRLRQKNGIISYKQFSNIVSTYQVEVDDLQVSRIPWEKYFTFSSRATLIDAEYSSAELIAVLFDIDLQSVKEWHSDPKRSSLAAFVQNNGGDYASRKNIIADKNFLGESICKVSFKSAGGQYKFKFEYIKGEAKYFEFYGKK